MPRPGIKIRRVGFEKAVTHLTFDCTMCTMRRAAWSFDPASDDFHYSLALNQDGRIMQHHHNRWEAFTPTVEDVTARDWEVRRA